MVVELSNGAKITAKDDVLNELSYVYSLASELMAQENNLATSEMYLKISDSIYDALCKKGYYNDLV